MSRAMTLVTNLTTVSYSHPDLVKIWLLYIGQYLPP